MKHIGTLLQRGLEEQVRSHGLQITYSGPPAIPFMSFVADEGSFNRSRTFCAEACQRGIYLHPVHNWFLSAAHSEADVRRTLEVTDEAFVAVKREFGPTSKTYVPLPEVLWEPRGLKAHC